jgi:hypothetical protein
MRRLFLIVWWLSVGACVVRASYSGRRVLQQSLHPNCTQVSTSAELVEAVAIRTRDRGSRYETVQICLSRSAPLSKTFIYRLAR